MNQKKAKQLRKERLMSDTPTEKRYDLKPIEQQMIKVLQDTYFTTLSNFLSFIALERLAYSVTGNTKFRIEDGSVYISEEIPPTAPTEVSTGSDTKEALK